MSKSQMKILKQIKQSQVVVKLLLTLYLHCMHILTQHCLPKLQIFIFSSDGFLLIVLDSHLNFMFRLRLCYQLVKLKLRYHTDVAIRGLELVNMT